MDPSTSQESTLISDTGHSSVDLCLRIRYKSSPNIAWVKYWGKYNEDYILPLNDSLGLTLNSDDLATITICSFSKQHNVDLFILNGEECSIGLRMRTVLNRVREKAYELYKGKISSAEWSLHHFKV